MVPEKIGGAAQCDHQPVIADVTDAGVDDFPRRVDPVDFRDVDMDVAGVLKDLPEREGDARRLEAGRGNLVHQRLEFVVVMTVDQINFVVGIVEGAGDAQSGETGADDDDACPGGNLCHTLKIVPGCKDTTEHVGKQKCHGRRISAIIAVTSCAFSGIGH
jgi:hypothetical protein